MNLPVTDDKNQDTEELLCLREDYGSRVLEKAPDRHTGSKHVKGYLQHLWEDDKDLPQLVVPAGQE